MPPIFLATEGTTTIGMSAEQATAINSAFGQMGETVLSDFISLLPTVATITGIAFVIYWVNKRANKLKKGK